MEPASFGRKLGIGMRVAGRMLDQRRQQREAAKTDVSQVTATQAGFHAVETFQRNSGRLAQGGKGFISGLTAPFARAGKALFYEISGLFFALFGLFFAEFAYKNGRQSATAAEHQHIFLYVGLAVLFGYFSVTSFLRARTVSGKQ